ncbi:YkvA family protein [Saccharibacillus sp. CPCC 101409]|uniref:YkvA family protein n=1 Tax=Saccharibacillus sp. CPCC 101409 TaxID=3058041 RepID=UPI002672A545|nr:YkvA family protein [Saccharibacillus sp. CPCC 101409]MDO3408474.1 YkvA family protein [Saccharibacillus sp. CPCC 101409]
MNETIQGYGKEYSEESFWDKIKKFGKKAGVKVVYAALLLFYTLKDRDVPPWAKSVIIGALAYFIAPIDLIPDFIPVAGYTDDLGTLLAALGVVSSQIDDEIRGKARARLVAWFGESATLDLGEVEARLDSSTPPGK